MVAVLAVEVYRGAASPSTTSSHHQTTSSDGKQKEISFEKLTDVIFLVLPEITPIVADLTKDLEEGQLKNLEVMIKIHIPIARAVVQTQAGEDGITEREEALLNDLETYLGALISLLQQRREKLDTNKKAITNPIPDYTHALDDSRPKSTLFHEHDIYNSKRKGQTPRETYQQPNEDSLPFNNKEKDTTDSSTSAESQNGRRENLGHSFFSLPVRN